MFVLQAFKHLLPVYSYELKQCNSFFKNVYFVFVFDLVLLLLITLSVLKKGLLSFQDWLVCNFYEQTCVTLSRNNFCINLFRVY